MGASASTSPRFDSGKNLSASTEYRSWSFLDEHGVHEIEFIHDLGTGGRRVLHNGEVAASAASFALFDAGGTYTFQVGRANCVLKQTPDGGAFAYELTIDGEAVEDYNTRMWSKCTRWFFSIDSRAHSCVVLDDGRFAVVVDGHAVHTESEFTERGSRHSLSVGGHTFVLDIGQPDDVQPAASVSADEPEWHSPLQQPPVPSSALFGYSVVGSPDIVSGGAAVSQLHPIPFGYCADSVTNTSSSSSTYCSDGGGRSIDNCSSAIASSAAAAVSPMARTPSRVAVDKRRHHLTLTIDGQIVAHDIQKRMLQPKLALGQPSVRRAHDHSSEFK